MQAVPWQIPPGFDRRSTKLAAAGRWVDGQLVRWRGGLPEKVGGWEKRTATQLVGIPRAVETWKTLSGLRLTAIGTNKKLYVWDTANLINITPFFKSGSLTDPFTTTLGSAVVQVAHAAHGLAVGQYVDFPDGSTAVGGITIDGEYTVTAKIDDDIYTITHSAAATSAASGGGTVTYGYEIPFGNADAGVTGGFGVGGFGEGGFGEESGTTIPTSPGMWTLDHFGETLYACPYPEGTQYRWNHGEARALPIDGAPAAAGIFVTENRHPVAFGAGGNRMRVHNGDLGVLEGAVVWDPSDTNQARREILSGGNRLIAGARASDGVNLVWSDTDVFAMQFLGSGQVPFRYLNRGASTGIVGPAAWARYLGTVYWMGPSDFWMYDGFTQIPPGAADIRDYIFGQNGHLNAAQQEKVCAVLVPDHQEIWWFYPGGANTENSHYVKHTMSHGCWDTGELARTAGQSSEIFGNPILTSPDGYLYTHETGVDDEGAASYAWLEAAPGDIRNGGVSYDIFGIYPDFARHVGIVKLTVLSRDHPQQTPDIEGPYPLLPNDGLQDLRAYGRQVGFKLETNQVGGDFRLGTPRVLVQEGGMRP